MLREVSRRQLDVPTRSASPLMIINRHTHVAQTQVSATISTPELDVVEEVAFYTPPEIIQQIVTFDLLSKQTKSTTALDYAILIENELIQGSRHAGVHRALSKTAYKASKLSDSLATHIPVVDTPSKKKRPSGIFHSFAPRAVTYMIIAAVIIGTSYLGFDVWTTNNQLKGELTTTAAALGSPNPSARQKSEGRDESNVNTDMIKNYTVSPSMPRTITIKKARIQARVLPMDVNPDNTVQAPVNIFDAGWYTGSAKPGEPGAALIDGHASGTTRQGEFAFLDRLQIGDSIEVERGDGQKLTYEVIYTETVPMKDVDMTKLLLPYGENAQGLNLITCTGKFTKNKDGSFTYDHRALVYAKRVS